jgi:tetratricopeptide (TPR) repeat protein
MRAILFILLAVTGAALAQTSVHLKDGRILPAKQLRREKDTIIATLDIPSKEPGGKPTTGDFGFPLKDIFKLDFPKPAVIDTAPDLIGDGKAEEALASLEPAIKYYGGFRDAPGSWWVDLVPLQIEALLALRRDKEAGEVADQFSRLATDPEVKKFIKAFTAVALTRKGEHQSALPLYDESARATERTDILGLIAVNKGDSLVAIAEAHAAKGEAEEAAVRFEEALLSFLRIPALYRTQRMFLPQATYGAAQAYLGMRDFDRARLAVKELKTLFPETPEAKATEELSKRIEKFAALLSTAEPEREPEKK